MHLRTSHQIRGSALTTDGPTRATITGEARRFDACLGPGQQWITAGILPGTQPVPHSPWAILRETLTTATVSRAVGAIRQARPPRPSTRTSQPTLGDPTS